ncbi:hypothetical protein GDO86_002510 [Hymenochirus boettgeri]|uniref:Uncharacterized protein n=1 Tax=Hymenochirus boettgeri TaxID=247094 RepID=A0A8T2KKE3_9PIPI|nr:hypothetical protein GDO86_002510 [Hymenochirus boettgeri]
MRESLFDHTGQMPCYRTYKMSWAVTSLFRFSNSHQSVTDGLAQLNNVRFHLLVNQTNFTLQTFNLILKYQNQL